MENLIAVSFQEYELFGCVNCGCEYCHQLGISGRGSTPVACGECKQRFVVLNDGVEQSAISFGDSPVYPHRQDHPRKGILKHEYIRPDIRPDTGGEYWRSRGVGYDLAGFVESKEAGQRIVAMVQQIIGKKPQTWLDYRKSEPNWIQVKVQEEDGFDLKKLNQLCSSDGIITEERLRQAKK